jgi:hypothetical protein
MSMGSHSIRKASSRWCDELKLGASDKPGQDEAANKKLADLQAIVVVEAAAGDLRLQ